MQIEEPVALDRHFAKLLARLAGGKNPAVELAALLVSHQQLRGNICLPLGEVAGQPLTLGSTACDRIPNLRDWVRNLGTSGLVGAPGEFKPLILDEANRLYLRRYWSYEENLARAIIRRLTTEGPIVDLGLLDRGLDRMFPTGKKDNSQRTAVRRAVRNNLTTITGGPGTGKTRTIVTILALLLEQHTGRFRVALAAPSGKAAARLQESVRDAREELDCSEAVKMRIPAEASTIHRLLGTIPDSPYFRHNSGHPLLADAVILDEASMVDLATMAKLFEAIPETARVILLGDKDQLASVEAGYVLADICSSSSNSKPIETAPQLQLPFGQDTTTSSLRNCIVQLDKNYRFQRDGGIYQLVTAINSGDAETAFRILRDKTHRDVTWKLLPRPTTLPKALREIVVSGYENYLKLSDPVAALDRFGDFRVLAAIKHSPFGVKQLNEEIERILAQAGLIGTTKPWYPGRAVMITRNDYNARLFNGDIGIAFGETDGDTRVCFSSTDGTIRRTLPARMPIHETAYAMTVHKAQGSEFKKVLLILPANDSELLTRELLYTGLTRARAQVEIWATEQVLRAAIARRVSRSSGLRDALWK